MKKEKITNTPSQTKKLGEELAKEILKKGFGRTAFVIGIEGELGGGKTTFLQGFAKGLGIKEKVLSPTFVILKKFRIPKSNFKKSNFKYFYHIDCYRLQKPKELLNIGFKEIASRPENIVGVEWAEKVKKILPKDVFEVKFRVIDQKKRKIVCG